MFTASPASPTCRHTYNSVLPPNSIHRARQKIKKKHHHTVSNRGAVGALGEPSGVATGGECPHLTGASKWSFVDAASNTQPSQLCSNKGPLEKQSVARWVLGGAWACTTERQAVEGQHGSLASPTARGRSREEDDKGDGGEVGSCWEHACGHEPSSAPQPPPPAHLAAHNGRRSWIPVCRSRKVADMYNISSRCGHGLFK